LTPSPDAKSHSASKLERKGQPKQFEMNTTQIVKENFKKNCMSRLGGNRSWTEAEPRQIAGKDCHSDP